MGTQEEPGGDHRRAMELTEYTVQGPHSSGTPILLSLKTQRRGAVLVSSGGLAWQGFVPSGFWFWEAGQLVEM
jgi:hypothetical protein